MTPAHPAHHDTPTAATPTAATAPKVDFAEPTTPYAAYAGIDTLHALLRPRTDVPAETGFIVTTQVMELLFGLIRHEWLAACAALRADDLTAAEAALRRGLHAQSVLTASWDLLATMTPAEFGAFRPALGEASGFQSYTYLLLEFLLGNKNPRLIRLYAHHPAVHAQLTEALARPGLHDEALSLLARRGIPVDDAAEAWLAVYRGDHADLQRLAELLLDTAEQVTRWRQRHLSSVRRSLGDKPGTGGSSGTAWLRKAAEQDVFPELWSIRGLL